MNKNSQFRPTRNEFDAIVEYQAKWRIAMLLHRYRSGRSERTERAIKEATDRLAAVAAVIGDDGVREIVAEVEDNARRNLGDLVWLRIKNGTSDEAAASDQEKSVGKGKSLLTVHIVAGSPEAGHWVHTHGMDSLGLPELEMRGVPSILADAATAALMYVAGRLQKPGFEANLGETVQIGRYSVARFERLTPVPGSEDHFRGERWALVPVEVECPECGEPACECHSRQS